MEEKREVLGSYHTHSKYSKYNHGKDSASNMIKSAQDLKLTEYAITDHGVKHIFGIRKKNVRKLRTLIDEANKTSDTKIYLGLELNLLGVNGETDYYDELDNLLDIRLMGVHKAGRVNVGNFFKFILPNLFKRNSPKTLKTNTEAYISAIKKYKIDLITHPQEYIRVNLYDLAKACVENNCYLELNNKHLNYTKEEIEEILPTGVKFIISSDAHKKENIAKFDRVLEFIDECNIPYDQIANLNKVPDFKNKY